MMHHDASPPTVRVAVAAAAAHTKLGRCLSNFCKMFSNVFSRTHLMHACLVTACAIGSKVDLLVWLKLH